MQRHTFCLLLLVFATNTSIGTKSTTSLPYYLNAVFPTVDHSNPNPNSISKSTFSNPPPNPIDRKKRMVWHDNLHELYSVDPMAVKRASVPVSNAWFKHAEMYDELTPSSIDPLPIQHPKIPILPQQMEQVVTLIIKYMSLYRSKEVTLLVHSIRLYYPTIHVLVGDDTHERLNKNDPSYIVPSWASDNSNTKLMLLPEDCGLSLGRNILVQSVQTPYFVLLDDDFLFTKNTRIEKFLGILLENPTVAIVGGGLSKPNTGFLSYGLDANVIQHSRSAVFAKSKQKFDHNGCRKVDATFNFFMARTAVIKRTPWNPALKIQEHEALFLMLKMVGGVGVVECPDVHILHNNKKNCKNCDYDKQQLANYNKKSHRQESALYSQDICKQFPGMNVLRSVYWSVVCDRSTYCERQPDEVLQQVVCTAFQDGDIAPLDAGWTDLYGKPTHLVQRAYQPVQMAGLDLLPPLLNSSVLRQQAAFPKYDIYIAIITWSGNSQARQVIRAFIQRMMASMARLGNDINIGFCFFVGKLTTAQSMKRFKKEQWMYNDIIQLSSADDGYNNLLSKVTASMRWIVSHVRANYVVKVDDDVYLNLPELVRHIHLLRLPTIRVYVGKVVPFGSLPIRLKGHKWEIPEDEFYGDKVPRHANGPCYMVSMDVADYIGRYQSLTSQFVFRIEDIFMGTILSNIEVFSRELSLPNPSEIDWFYRRDHGRGQLYRNNPLLLNLDHMPREISNAANKERHEIVAYHSVKHLKESFPIIYELCNAPKMFNVEHLQDQLFGIEQDTIEDVRRLNAILVSWMEFQKNKNRLEWLNILGMGLCALCVLACGYRKRRGLTRIWFTRHVGWYTTKKTNMYGDVSCEKYVV
jgi:hypothetical protein